MDKLFLLCRKNWIILRRRWVSTLLIILLPGLVSLTLLIVRSKTSRFPVPKPSQWDKFSVNNFPFSKSNWTLVYAPESIFTTDIMDKVKQNKAVNIFAYPNEAQMLAYLNDQLDGVAGIVFHSNDIYNPVSYSIRMHSSASWETRLLYPRFPILGPRTWNKYAEPPNYVTTGFLAIQKAVDVAVIQKVGEVINGTFDIPIDCSFKRLPYPAHLEDVFTLVIEQQLALLIVIGFLFPAVYLIKRILEEKSSRIKESIRIMGASSMTYWMSWFLTFSILFCLSSAVVTAALSIDFVGGGGSVRMLPLSDPSIIFCSLFVYSLALISFILALSPLFHSPNSGAAVTCTILILSFIPYQLISVHYERYHLVSKLVCCLIPNMGIGFIAFLVGHFEGVGVGAQWSLFFQQVSSDDDLRLDMVWSVMFFDILFYLFIAWYADNLWPGKYGVPKPWHFPVSSLLRYRPVSTGQGMTTEYNVGSLITTLSDLSPDEENADLPVPSSCHPFESAPIGLGIGISIQNLRKVYSKAKTLSPAVANVSMNVYEGQITILLGQNGAGKTTLMSMLTGLIPLTSGNAYINGHSIATDIESVRRSLGFCPQHNLLFDHLTVAEHLWLFARLKGCRQKDVDAHVSTTLSKIGLKHKSRALSSTLSGGAKRRLSLGVALIGNSKVVILDEPTSGLDPSARRQIWDILQHECSYRTILVSTHYMDEAEYLGDRIAIMSSGRLKCLGSPFFLKSIFGTGYTLTMTLSSGEDSEREVEEIIDFIKEYVPQSKIYSHDGSELKVLLPVDAVLAFENLFSELEKVKLSLGILDFGVSVTTMEEVFFRVAAQVPMYTNPTLNEPVNQLASFLEGSTSSSGDSYTGDVQTLIPIINNAGLQFRSSGVSYLHQMLALVHKRYAHAKRTPVLTLAQLIIPGLCALLAHIVYREVNGEELDDQPTLLLSFASPLFGKNLIVPTSIISNSSLEAHALLSAFEKQFDPQQVSLLRINNSLKFEASILEKTVKSIHFYTTRYIVGLVVGNGRNIKNPLSNSTLRLDALVYFMGESFHALPVAQNAISNALLQLMVASSTNRSFDSDTFRIETINSPLSTSPKELIGELSSPETWINVVISGVTLSVDALAGVAFLVASLVLCLIHERAAGSKHLQFISGVRFSTYWGSMYTWDGLTYFSSSFIFFLVFALFNVDAFARGTRLYLVGLLCLAYGWSAVSLMYLLSSIFTSPSSGLVWLTALNVFSGIIGTLVVQGLCIPLVAQQWLALRLRNLLIVISPSFAFCDALYSVNANFKYTRLCDSPEIQATCETLLQQMPCCMKTCTPFCAYWTRDYLSIDTAGIGRHLLAMTCQGFFWGFWVLFTDTVFAHRLWLWMKSGMCPTCCGRPNRVTSDETPIPRALDDEDVSRHRDEVHSILVDRLRQESSLALLDVTKVYESYDGIGRQKKMVTAVDSVSLVVSPGECFGLLGVNGAGKSTLFELITGKVDATQGRLFANGFDVLKECRQAQQSIGFCPQFDALLDHLTCRETLHLFGRLRGLQANGELFSRHIDTLLARLQLTNCTHLSVAHLSGGKRRRLSLAIALLGAPPLICLDEPTAGVDPVSRRRIWNLLSEYRKAGSTLIISSHSMDECEALCTRMGVMVNGRFKCLGSCQHLKSRFGEGYSICVQVCSPSYPTSFLTHRSQPPFLISAATSRSSSVSTTTAAINVDDNDDNSRNTEWKSSVDIAAVDRVVRFFETEFPNIRLLDRHQGVLQFHIVENKFCLSRIFGLMECYKTELGISTYQVSQTKLEQIFVSLAQQQDDPAPEQSDRRFVSLISACSHLKQISSSVCSCCCRSSAPLIINDDDELSSLSILV